MQTQAMQETLSITDLIMYLVFNLAKRIARINFMSLYEMVRYFSIYVIWVPNYHCKDASKKT